MSDIVERLEAWQLEDGPWNRGVCRVAQKDMMKAKEEIKLLREYVARLKQNNSACNQTIDQLVELAINAGVDCNKIQHIINGPMPSELHDVEAAKLAAYEQDKQALSKALKGSK